MEDVTRATVVAVSEDDRSLGAVPRREAHSGRGILHRAVSLYVFDGENRVLLQRRGSRKLLWPGFWSNSCCTHPFAGEEPRDTCRRRALEELGIRVEPSFAFRYEYEARYLDVGVEHEICHVFLARWIAGPDLLAPDPQEVDAVAWRTVEDLGVALADASAPYTPWLRIAWPRVEAAAPRLLR